MSKKAKRGANATPHSDNNTSSYMTQEEQVLDYMRKHGSITSWEAIWEYHITRLAAVVCNMRKDGYDIDTIYETNQYGTRYGRYVLKEEPDYESITS